MVNPAQLLPSQISKGAKDGEKYELLPSPNAQQYESEPLILSLYIGCRVFKAAMFP